jgi:Bacterial alpha-L-rhamnosidase C-terminal domain/Alpha-L-rhamnosidase N-terminal domain/Bacterial alpha-L-rhamnosidase concanavalin-like domain
MKALAPVPYLRRAFRLVQPVRSVASARLYVTALGLYEARLNGARVGQTDEFVTPGGTAIFEPRFTLHGFRFAEISGFPGEPMTAWMDYLERVNAGYLRTRVGIEPKAGSAGFGQLVLRPHPGGQFSWASGCYQSVRGPIVTRWQRSGGRFTFSAELPPNTTASVRIPSDDASDVRDADGGQPERIAVYPGASGISEAVFEVGSGTHEFSGPAAAFGWPMDRPLPGSKN